MVFSPQSGYSSKPDIAGQLNALSAILANIGAQRSQDFQERKRREIAAEREITRKEEFAKQLALDTKLINAQVAKYKADEALIVLELERVAETEELKQLITGPGGIYGTGQPGAPTVQPQVQAPPTGAGGFGMLDHITPKPVGDLTTTVMAMELGVGAPASTVDRTTPTPITEPQKPLAVPIAGAPGVTDQDLRDFITNNIPAHLRDNAFDMYPQLYTPKTLTERKAELDIIARLGPEHITPEYEPYRKYITEQYNINQALDRNLITTADANARGAVLDADLREKEVQYYDKKVQADIAYTQAATGLAGAQAEKLGRPAEAPAVPLINKLAIAGDLSDADWMKLFGGRMPTEEEKAEAEVNAQAGIGIKAPPQEPEATFTVQGEVTTEVAAQNELSVEYNYYRTVDGGPTTATRSFYEGKSGQELEGVIKEIDEDITAFSEAGAPVGVMEHLQGIRGFVSQLRGSKVVARMSWEGLTQKFAGIIYVGMPEDITEKESTDYKKMALTSMWDNISSDWSRGEVRDVDYARAKGAIRDEWDRLGFGPPPWVKVAEPTEGVGTLLEQAAEGATERGGEEAEETRLIEPTERGGRDIEGWNPGHFESEVFASHTKRDIEGEYVAQGGYSVEDISENVSNVIGALQPVVAEFGYPSITSFYRSPAVNTKVDGAKTSRHMAGLGIDVSFGDTGINKTVYEWLIKNFEFLGQGVEILSPRYEYGFIHIALPRPGVTKKDNLDAKNR